MQGTGLVELTPGARSTQVPYVPDDQVRLGASVTGIGSGSGGAGPRRWSAPSPRMRLTSVAEDGAVKVIAKGSTDRVPRKRRIRGSRSSRPTWRLRDGGSISTVTPFWRVHSPVSQAIPSSALKVTHISCNPAATQSELQAFVALKSGLISLPGDGQWILLTNVAFSVTHRLQSDEIDVVAVGPPGVRVIEVKHWGKPGRELAEREADRLSMKARRIGTTLRKLVPRLPHVEGAMLLTRPAAEVPPSIRNTRIRGVPYLTLKDWREAAGAGGHEVLTAHEIRRIARVLKPRISLPVDGSLRRLGGYVNLEAQEGRGNGAHRIYRGIHSVTRDRVVLHLYDRSAIGSRAATVQARRHYDRVRGLQLYSWAPRVQDSLQDVPGYRDELSFFTVLDPGAPTMRERSADATWDVAARIAFGRLAIEAVAQLLRGGPGHEPMVHGNLSPETILVMHDNSPVIRGFGVSEEGSGSEEGSNGRWSDVRALRESLASLFADADGDRQAESALAALLEGQFGEREAAEHLDVLARRMGDLIGKSTGRPPAPPARFWTEGQDVSFRGRRYRIVAPLGAGGSGTAYKVVELDSDTGEEVGTFVAKVGHDQEHGERICTGYKLVRSAAGRHPGLSAVLEVVGEWKDNEFAALMAWVDGAALSDFVGLLPLLAEKYGREPRDLALGWLRDMCEALDVLHRNGLVHGDVSPRNMIVAGQELVLTDYDCSSRVGDPVVDPGTVPYCAPSRRVGERASPATDLHALAASFFHVLFDREPFASVGQSRRKPTLDWRDDDRDAYPELMEFFDKATGSSTPRRFASAAEALNSLPATGATPPKQDSEAPVPPVPTPQPVAQRSRNEVTWLRKLLDSYPGSRHGNTETRGLDTDFARSTYIETDLEDELLVRISEGTISLVVLCGNAGDGKTALLQYLAYGLGMGRHRSSQRIVDEVLDDGTRVRINLDGSAAHQGRSADEILDGFLDPFRNGPPAEGRLVHLLAVNDGRLLEWIRRPPTETPLKKALMGLLGGPGNEIRAANPHIAFHHLNRRSRVGRVIDREITTEFMVKLLRELYGGDNAGATWSPCRTCSAKERCRVFEATRVFGPKGVPERASSKVRERGRQRLFAALQAVHFRGETHITVRELRAALVYILFGTRDCRDYHEGTADSEPAYWDRAFGAESPRRQGEVLRELLRLDPALEAHPKVDRRVLRESGIAYGQSDSAALASRRRRAYFEWTESEIQEVTGEEAGRGLGLASGRNLTDFGSIPLLDDEGRRKLCRKLCEGIARIGDLPELALARKDVVPLRITPRTPTETAFWTEKPFARFRLDPDSADGLGDGEPSGAGAERELHRAAYLVYEYEDGREEPLRMSADLFHRLLRLSEGYQLADISTDDTFARLSIFLQRIAREGDREIMAWTPLRDAAMFRVSIDRGDEPVGDKQMLAIRAVDSAGTAP